MTAYQRTYYCATETYPFITWTCSRMSRWTDLDSLMVVRQQCQWLIWHQEQKLVKLFLYTHPLLHTRKLSKIFTHRERIWKWQWERASLSLYSISTLQKVKAGSDYWDTSLFLPATVTLNKWESVHLGELLCQITKYGWENTAEDTFRLEMTFFFPFVCTVDLDMT